MRRKLTATLISKLTVPDGKKSIKIFDTEVAGLGVRKMATGIASFIFEKRPKGAAAAKQITLGRCGDWTVDQARAKARQLADVSRKPAPTRRMYFLFQTSVSQ